jgi:hypothetical protein
MTYYYLVMANDGTQYVETSRPLTGDHITPLTKEQYDIIMEIYRLEDEGAEDFIEENE